ncbi:SusC/RagA family TonB-linked outer membrane protein [Desertivirga xinjiangensis]|uniref:SusC/RagA family TonB-linked outer membrane protein n=1 Tax=Desertivirga xinjiangensis TaxID=539206 RepID=UPI002109167F|nr:TonB-dependent receptor [Pedobacter xinjiangensis]
MKLFCESKKSIGLVLPTRGFKLLFVLIFLIIKGELYAQEKVTVTGTVRDTTGETLIGVSITAVNKKGVGTTTNDAGKFILEVESGTLLRISYVGFNEQTITVSPNNRVLNIVMKDAGTLEDVVVVAYGTKQRREAIVGSVTSVRPGDLKIPASNLTNALAGQVAGVIAYQRSGQPGQDNASFFIRGVTTFGYKRDPLILIDNVELTPSDLARLQVDDIESFSVLKDASATALYGARGANGVILVSTKQGKEGKATISFRLENSLSQSAQTLELADPITFMRLFNEATVTRNPLTPLPFSQNKINNTLATINRSPGYNEYVYPAVDWLDLLFKKRAATQRANLSVSGGGGVAKYYVSGSYNVDNGILNQDERNNANTNVKFRNYQLRSNVNINLTKSTELVVRLAGTFSDYNGPIAADGGFSTDLYNVAMHTSPVLFAPYYPADEANQNSKHILFGNVGGNNSIEVNNPYALLLRGHKNSTESRMSAQLELNQKMDFITKGLSFRSIFSTNRYSYFDSQMAYGPFYYNIGNYDKAANQYTLAWLNPRPNDGSGVPNVAQEYLSYYPGEPNLNTFLYGQAAAAYDRTFGDHNVSGTIIGTAQQTIYSNARDPKTNSRTLQYSLPYRNLGVAGRLTYSFKNKYFLEANFGYNGSERFSEDHRFGFFPTIGGGWVLSNERFFDNLKSVIDRFKIRASYGLVGNDAIGSQRFFYQSDVNLNGGGNYSSFGTNLEYTRTGVFINSYENRAITWETSRQTNLAFELSLLRRFNLTAELYRNFRYNILMDRSSIPQTMGLESLSPVSANIGTAKSKGIDLHLDYSGTIGRKVSIRLLSNFTYSSNKYVHYEEPQWEEPYRFRSGQSIDRNFGYIAERLFVDDKEAINSPKQIFSTGGTPPKGGDIKYRDLNEDGVIDGYDQTFIGFPQTPEIVYGFGLSSRFKNFDLGAFFQGQARVSLFINPGRVSPFIQSPDANIYGNTQLLKAFADDHWSIDNQNLYALYPRLGTNGGEIENNRQNSTWWMRNGSFMRLKSLELGYTLPSKLSRKIQLRSARVYFNGLNLVTWSPFKLWDPELGGNGFAYPIQKVFNLGVNVSL